MQFRRPRALFAGLIAAGLWVSVVGISAAPSTAIAPGSVFGRASSNAHFSNPNWLMFREPTTVSCTLGNPEPGPHISACGHKGWALDFIGKANQPVYSAGWGIAHVGGRSPACRSGGGSDSNKRGNWVWVDQGGATKSFYYHLDNISVGDGQQVGPDSQLGTMGTSGAVGCGTPQLHFEVQVNRKQVNPGQLRACYQTRAVTEPAAAGYSGWGEVPRDKVTVSSTGSTCSPEGTRAPSPTGLTLKKGKGKIKVRWVASPGASDYWIEYRKRHGRRWDKNFTYQQTTSTSMTIRGLNRYGKYEVGVAANDSAGPSGWATKKVQLHP